MKSITWFVLYVVAAVCFSSSLNAAPITYTYTTNVFTRDYLEDWQVWALDNGFVSFHWPSFLEKRAEIILEVDCDFNDANSPCLSPTSGAAFEFSLEFGAIKFLGASGFLQGLSSSAVLFSIEFDSLGNPTVWYFYGPEIYGIGDMFISSNGDKIAAYAQDFSYPAGLAYCRYTYGPDPGHTDSACANGDTSGYNGYREIEIGQGTWTVSTVPLPGSLPLLAGLLGATWIFRRRSSTRVAK